jgi:hypothetical protein
MLAARRLMTRVEGAAAAREEDGDPVSWRIMLTGLINTSI